METRKVSTPNSALHWPKENTQTRDGSTLKYKPNTMRHLRLEANSCYFKLFQIMHMPNFIVGGMTTGFKVSMSIRNTLNFH